MTTINGIHMNEKQAAVARDHVLGQGMGATYHTGQFRVAGALPDDSIVLIGPINPDSASRFQAGYIQTSGATFFRALGSDDSFAAAVAAASTVPA